ncbi:methyltransferase domain-containing protein [Carboxylicivirga sediminis]|uniref:Methyltransferase domain-containing protein n=1 Tax=Carboxylicivirga sediminis TaxID=2006564 RepID=A0A941F1F1_9BACT|nr:class I SAM-dependent methyltransferase [Carboxylicivirga sediminis]MBR8535056.1 methyltransferase domain-containing protein [Carboxylicivirga sediminis]
MVRLFTLEDARDLFLKGKQRGYRFLLSKLSFSETSRTISAFDKSAQFSSNWWDIPYIQKHWNKRISGNETQGYEAYFVNSVLGKRSNLKLLSIGSGSCEHEIRFAGYRNFKMITCVDLSPFNIELAQKKASKKNLTNIEFICANLAHLDLSKKQFDIVMFNASLHHFKKVNSLLSNTILPLLPQDGILLINEFVGANRLQFPREQINTINQAIKLIPKRLRRRLNTSLYKNSFSGSGLVRMFMADPSECVDSYNIMPAIHKHFKIIDERPYGGNILMSVLKDIAHNFIEESDETKSVLDKLIAVEDDYLKNHPSDFVFGVYQKK